jgi:hypothetical protein
MSPAGGQARQAWSTTGRRRWRGGSRRAGGLRRGRIFARLREGWAYDEIAAHGRLTAERVRQIIRQRKGFFVPKFCSILPA